MNYFGKVLTAAALLVSCSQNMFAQHAPAAEQPSTAPAAESAPDFPEDAPMMQGSSEPRLYNIRIINNQHLIRTLPGFPLCIIGILRQDNPDSLISNSQRLPQYGCVFSIIG